MCRRCKINDGWPFCGQCIEDLEGWALDRRQASAVRVDMITDRIDPITHERITLIEALNETIQFHNIVLPWWRTEVMGL